MYYYHPQERATKELFPGIIARTFWGEKMLLAVVDLAANAVLPNHSHPHEQGGIMIEGEMEWTIGGETRVLKPGDIYIIPGDIEHSAKVGDKPVKVLDIFSPIREAFQY
jgi:quercetin dioxygenase-like cupin family protein